MEILGILSALLSLSAFAANQYGFINADSVWYDSANLMASAGLIVYAVSIDSVPFILINAVWGAVSGIDVIRYVFGAPRRTRPAR